MFGGQGGRESRPQFVTDTWSIASEFLEGDKGMVRQPPMLLLSQQQGSGTAWPSAAVSAKAAGVSAWATCMCSVQQVSIPWTRVCTVRRQLICSRPGLLQSSRRACAPRKDDRRVIQTSEIDLLCMQEEYSRVDLSLACADGSKIEKPGDCLLLCHRCAMQPCTG